MHVCLCTFAAKISGRYMHFEPNGKGNMTEKYDIAKLLASQFLPLDTRELDASYQQTAANTGEKKAKRYEEFLQNAIPASQQPGFAFLSIGGADGSEIEYVASKFGFELFILCEVSHDVVKSAESLAERLRDSGKTLEIVVGDIWDKRHEITDIVKKHGKYRIVVSAQSVLHELPTRSTQSDIAPQFVQLLSYAEDTILLSSDPTGNTGDWPDKVFISSQRLNPDDLFQLASYIHQLYFEELSAPEKIGDRTYCDAIIALETFYKIAHQDGNERLKYELGECLSKFPREAIQRMLRANGYEIATAMWQSDRLRQSFETNFLVQSAESSDGLQFPETFLSIFAKKNF